VEAAIQSAHFYRQLNELQRGRTVLSPFESLGNPDVLIVLASVDSRLGNRDLAVAEYQRAIEAAERVADVDVRGTARSQFGYELYRKSHFEEAVRTLDAVLRSYAGKLSPRIERSVRLNLSRALQEMGDAPAAEAEFRRLREFLDTAPMLSIELLFDARLHKEAGQLQSADELLKKAQQAARSEANRFLEAFAVLRRLEIAVKLADWERTHALSAEVQAFKEVLQLDGRRQLAAAEEEAARDEGRLEESRRLLEQERGMSPPPNELWELEYESGLTWRALGQLGDARKSFEASISDVETQRKDLVDPGLQAALIGSRQKPYDALFEMYAASGDGASALATLQKALASRLDTAVAEASNSAGHEVGDALDRSAARRTLKEADRDLPERQSNAGGRNARFVAFVTTDNHSWSVVHADGHSLVEQIQVSPKELCSLMQRFGEDLDDESGARLGSALFPPSTLARLGARFAIILPSCARNFPVTAVRIKDGRLLDRAVVSVASDVSTVTRPGNEAHRETTQANLVLADPLGDLPSAREEAERTGRLTGAEVRLGMLASSVPLETSGRHLLHFATHTAVDVAGPALVLADRRVSVADILRRRLRADLVVLASCHSGSKLEGTVAETLSTAFLRAGSGAVLATLRSVEDRFASEVVRAFYEHGGLDDPAGALARVQRQLARTEPPARWAAFFVAGSPEPMHRPTVSLRRAQAFGG
jgi:tetratricopeptide (TPR) repeat protein